MPEEDGIAMRWGAPFELYRGPRISNGELLIRRFTPIEHINSTSTVILKYKSALERITEEEMF